MMNEDMLKKIDALRERADVSYEEAANLLEQNDGDVIRALMVLEQQGRLKAKATPQPHAEQWQAEAEEVKEKAKGFFEKAMNSRLVVEKKNEAGEKETILNLNIPFAAGAAIVAPWLAAGSAIAAAVTGCNVKVEEDEEKKQ